MPGKTANSLLKLMRFANHTSTEIELVVGDVRQFDASLTVVGRDSDLRRHYSSSFPNAATDDRIIDGFPVELVESNDRMRAALFSNIRPRGSTRHRVREINRIHASLVLPLCFAITRYSADIIDIAPLSCRRPDTTAYATIRMLWDISVASFLDVDSMFLNYTPKLFRLFVRDSLDPYISVLNDSHYTSLNHGYLFNTEVQCNRGKRERYLRRNRFRFVSTGG